MIIKNIFLSLLFVIFATSCLINSEPEPIAPEIEALFAVEDFDNHNNRTLVVCVASDKDSPSSSLNYNLILRNGVAYHTENRHTIIVETGDGLSPSITCKVTDDTNLSVDQTISL